MIIQGIIGFIIGFIVGMGINAYLLRDTPRAEFLVNKKLRLRFGGLNWGVALAGMAIALAIAQTKI